MLNKSAPTFSLTLRTETESEALKVPVLGYLLIFGKETGTYFLGQ
jgi:hypothetical protein